MAVAPLYIVTVEPISAVPVKIRPLAVPVISSEFNAPVSDAGDRSGADGADGMPVSTIVVIDEVVGAPG